MLGTGCEQIGMLGHGAGGEEGGRGWVGSYGLGWSDSRCPNVRIESPFP